ncbi:MAG: RluA family pseudouridine synthase [Desulfobulbaceae bacterium]|nr:RluA family pseudouridine synthase [Desulfobulbaceae bacterium]
MTERTGCGETVSEIDESPDSSPVFFCVVPGEAGQRLDRFLVSRFSELSRSAVGRLILSGHVTVNKSAVKAGYRLRQHDQVVVSFPPVEPSELIAEPIDFTILFEDEYLLVLVKPPGLVVHPAAGHWSGTLVNGLLYHCKQLAALDPHRPGIVHRLDKDTSGIMLVGKTAQALRFLADDFKNRKIQKTYQAILLRCPQKTEGRLVAPMGRHPVNRKKMAVRHTHGRYAATRWQVREHFDCGMCFVRINIETGRTHQIRVHMASMGTPVAGDALYGGRIPENFFVRADRQLLHASAISFLHPQLKKEMSFTAPLWPDMQEVLDSLRRGS